MRYTIRELVYIGVFGALWGVIETSTGSLLHVLNVPFAGAMLTGLGICIALIGRLYVPRRGSVLFIGCVTALIKMLSLGGVVLNPMIGILAESLLAEAVLDLAGRPGRPAFAGAGAMAVLWTMAHPFFTQGLLAGQGILVIYLRTIDKGAKLLGLNASIALAVLGVLIAVHLLLGVAAGILAWDAGRITLARRTFHVAPGAG